MEITKYPGACFRSDADGMVLLGALYNGSGETRFPTPEFLHAGEAEEPVAWCQRAPVHFHHRAPGKAPAYALGDGFSAGYWWHVTVPIITRLREAIDKTLRTPAVFDTLRKDGLEPLTLSPAEADKVLKEAPYSFAGRQLRFFVSYNAGELNFSTWA